MVQPDRPQNIKRRMRIACWIGKATTTHSENVALTESPLQQWFAEVPLCYKACPNESGTEVGPPLFPAVELFDFPGRWQCMSGDIWHTLDSGSVLLTEAEAR